MALGSMSYVEARKCAEDLKVSADLMDQYFEQLKVEMKVFAIQGSDQSITNKIDPDVVLQSESGEKLYEEYKSLEQKLSGYSNKIRDFETFLRKAVDKYESDDNALGNEVQ